MKMKTLSAAVAATVLALAAGQAIAGKSKGSMGNTPGEQQASVAVQTTCAVTDDAKLAVSVRVSEKSSGDTMAFVDLYRIDAAYKEKGPALYLIDGESFEDGASDPAVNGELELPVVEFDLCTLIAKAGADAKSLNASVTVDYAGVDGQPGKIVVNQCSDDPTTDAIEPAGIKIEDVAYLCP